MRRGGLPSFPSVPKSLGDHEDRIKKLEFRPTGGAVQMSPAAVLGNVVGGARLSNGLGVSAGVLYIPDRDGSPLETGEVIGIDFSHYDPNSHFPWAAARLHLITGLSSDRYAYNHPWESSPWNGGIGGYHSSGGSILWNRFHSFLAVSDDDSDSVTWTSPAAVGAEQYSFDDAGYGHIGYTFHDFSGASTTTTAAATFSGAPTETAGAIVHSITDGTVVLGAVVGEATTANTVRFGVTLTDDVPADSGLIVVVANRVTAGFYPGDVQSRPRIEVRVPASDLIPKYRVGTQLYPFFERTGGSVEQTLDGGGP